MNEDTTSGQFTTKHQSMSDSELICCADPAMDDVQYLEDRIRAFNTAATGITDGQWLAIFMRDNDQRIVAGICGDTWGGCAEIRQFWVEEERRGQGIGTRLLEAAEQEAHQRGCRQMLITTFSFQAPGFYTKHGFEIVTMVNNHPHGHTSMLLRKKLGE